MMLRYELFTSQQLHVLGEDYSLDVATRKIPRLGFVQLETVHHSPLQGVSGNHMKYHDNRFFKNG